MICPVCTQRSRNVHLCTSCGSAQGLHEPRTDLLSRCLDWGLGYVLLWLYVLWLVR